MFGIKKVQKNLKYKFFDLKKWQKIQETRDNRKKKPVKHKENQGKRTVLAIWAGPERTALCGAPDPSR
jgi:hypothetical protein